MKTATTTNQILPTKVKPALNETTNKSFASKDPSKATAADQTPYEPNSATERIQGLTTYVDALETLEDERQLHVPPLTRSSLQQHDPDLLRIDKFASRPTLLKTGTWSATDMRNSVLFTNSVVNAAVNNSSILYQKLNYYQFISFDIVVRFIANPMQMQAGRLWMSFEYARAARGARVVQNEPVQYTALPGVEYDPGMPAPVELRIPFYSVYSQWDTIFPSFSNGVLQLRVLSPLNSATTATSLGYNIYTWIENLNVGVPTSTPMGLAEPVLLSAAKPAFAMAQSSSEKHQAATNHRISDTLDRVGAVADAIGIFPMMNAISTPVSWLSHAAATAARAFGFAKPDNATVAMRTENFPLVTATHMDGPSSSVPLTATANFEIPSGAHFGTEIDEMDINYICAKLVNVAAYNWTAETSAGSGIAAIPIHPGLCDKVAEADAVVYERYATTPMAYVASMFKFWAGSIKIRLEAVSTPFHAGRLLITYQPDYDPLAPFTPKEDGNVYSIIWDITDSSHIEFAVPYMSNSPFLDVMLDDIAWSHVSNDDFLDPEVKHRIRRISNGTIYVSVLAPLVSPATTSNNIDLLVWIGGGEDLCFSEPHIGTYLPCIDGGQIDKTGKYYDNSDLVQPTAGITPTLLVDDFVFATAQSLSIHPATGIDQNNASTVADAKYDNWIPFKPLKASQRASLCTGEVITNLRLMTRRSSPAYHMFPHDVTNAGAMDVFPPTSNHVLVLDPDYFGAFPGNHDNALYNRHIAPVKPGEHPWLTELPSVLSYISLLYTYVRGTRRYSVVTNPSSTINGAPFTTLADSTSLKTPQDTGMFDIRMSQVLSHSQTPTQPWFMPEVSCYGYNREGSTFATLSFNYKHGLGSFNLGDSFVRRMDTPGTNLEVTVNSSTNWPTRVLCTSSSNTEATNNVVVGYSTARTRRFVEIRYRPFTTAMDGETANYQAHYWPFPTIIMEAAGDDMSFGLAQQSPYVRRIAKTTVFSKLDGSLLML